MPRENRSELFVNNIPSDSFLRCFSNQQYLCKYWQKCSIPETSVTTGTAHVLSSVALGSQHLL